MVNITILNDDRCKDFKCKSSHGLSMLIEYDKYKFLFDAGQDDLYLKNAISLGLELNDINCVALSHGHYDHSIGLKYLNSKIKLICHPDCVIWRKSKRTNKYNGLPFSKEEFETRFNVVYTKEPYNITNNIVYLGEIERKNNFECKNFPSIYKNGEDDIALDDTGLAIKTKNGLIVISGCGHSGICNTIEYAKKVTKTNNVLAVIGGFHLKQINEQVKETINYFNKEKIKNIYLGHCTSDVVCDYIKEQLLGCAKVEVFGAGLTIAFN